MSLNGADVKSITQSPSHGHCVEQYLLNSIEGKRINKDQCLKCYDDPRCPNGLDICLKCLNGFCRSDFFNHSRQHFQIYNHCIMMNIRQIKKKKEKQNTDELQKIEKLDIEKPEGGEALGEDYEQIVEVRCLVCKKVLEYEKDEDIASLVASILNTASESERQKKNDWEDNILPCEHTLTLQQNEGIKIEENYKCSNCDLKSNLWLCLTCGNISCGRKDTGGNEHAIEHYKNTNHPLVVKIGTISPDSQAS